MRIGMAAAAAILAPALVAVVAILSQAATNPARRRPRPARRIQALPCPPVFARRSSPTISAMPAISPSRQRHRLRQHLERCLSQRQPPPGGFLVALRDTKGDGHADVVARFGEGAQRGRHRHRLLQRRLFAERRIASCAIPCLTMRSYPRGKPETIISGLPLSGDHPMHPFAIDARAVFSSISVRRQTPARQRIGCRELARTTSLARNSKHGLASGATTPTRRARFLAGRAFRDGAAQWRRDLFRRGRPHLRHPARPRPAL